MEEPSRLIGRYCGPERGPLLIALGGMHGNEPAGIRALELMFDMLEVEPEVNPGFRFRGRLVGLRGNVQAIARGERFIGRDLNRMLTSENVAAVRRKAITELLPEERELRELIETIEQEVADYRPDRLVVLDLHTTGAAGGIFSVVSDDPVSIRIAVELHAPVIKGMLRGIRGTTLHYFQENRFPGTKTVSIAFEAGQHDDPLSVNRTIAALINCMRTIGCVRPEDVENRHDALLIEYSRHLPKVAELIMCHSIRPEDNFRMMPDYQNFQPVKKGELLARDKNGPIRADVESRILMPLYQKQGDDGFFLIREADY